MSRITRREFSGRLAGAGMAAALARFPFAHAAEAKPTDAVVGFPGPWAFGLPKGAMILVSDQQLEDLQDPDKEVNLSLSATPEMTTLRALCARQQGAGSRTVILAFDHFFAQYRPGQAKRVLMPDMDDYIRRVAKIGETLKAHGLGFELSLLSPLELGAGYRQRTGEGGVWVQYREGVRDPSTGRYELQLWEHQRWTNNKGSIEVRRVGVRVFAFREHRVGGTPCHVVDPRQIVELKEPPTVEAWDGARGDAGDSFRARRLVVSGRGETGLGALDRVLVVVRYETPELDYFSPQAAPFLRELVERYHRAGVPLNGLYADEMHIQQDWAYHGHHDEGQFTLRYLTPRLAEAFAAAYGAEFADLEKYLVYFCYGQHGFLPGLEARLPAQHVLGGGAEDVQRTALLRRRYYELLSRTVVGLFADAKAYAEKLYGHELEARAHATWAQSPTIDLWDAGAQPMAPRQYEYTSNFTWANTVHQAAAACDDYFRWNDFLTGGGNDHTEGGWLDRDYYALALACSTGILNRVPYAYAAHWGMPGPVSERRQALVDAYGAAASPPFQAIEDSQHRDTDVLMLYPISLVAAEERFGSWMVQYGYANYVTADRLLERGRVTEDGFIEMAGRRFTTLVVLFEPLPPAGLLPFLKQFVRRRGRVIWSGPLPSLDFDGRPVREACQELLGIRGVQFGVQGFPAPGEVVTFEGELASVPAQTILTHLLVDHLYPVVPADDASVVARVGERVVGVRRKLGEAGEAVYLGFRPRDDQSASLGVETRCWFEVLRALGTFRSADAHAAPGDEAHPDVISRTSPWLCCRFPNGTVTVAAHFRHYVEGWPGGFARNAEEDARILAARPLPAVRLDLAAFKVAGHEVGYQGRMLLAFRPGPHGKVLAFGGYDCTGLRLDGVEQRLAARPLPFLAFAPVAAERRVAGGAVMEIWVQGAGEVRIPLAPGIQAAQLFDAAGVPGRIAGAVPSRAESGWLVFDPAAAGFRRHLYVMPADHA